MLSPNSTCPHPTEMTAYVEKMTKHEQVLHGNEEVSGDWEMTWQSRSVCSCLRLTSCTVSKAFLDIMAILWLFLAETYTDLITFTVAKY